jgi:hypothetical protein
LLEDENLHISIQTHDRELSKCRKSIFISKNNFSHFFKQKFNRFLSFKTLTFLYFLTEDIKFHPLITEHDNVHDILSAFLPLWKKRKNLTRHENFNDFVEGTLWEDGYMMEEEKVFKIFLFLVQQSFSFFGEVRLSKKKGKFS